MNDQEHADQIRGLSSQLREAIADAFESGLAVSVPDNLREYLQNGTPGELDWKVYRLL